MEEIEMCWFEYIKTYNLDWYGNVIEVDHTKTKYEIEGFTVDDSDGRGW